MSLLARLVLIMMYLATGSALAADVQPAKSRITVRGVVQESDTRPAADVEISIIDERNAVIATSTTGKSGVFSFSNLSLHPGTYSIRFGRRPGVQQRKTFDILPGDEERIVDVILRLPPPPVSKGIPSTKNYATVTVFYATDRKPDDVTTPATYFGGVPSENDDLTFGTVDVSIPRYHEIGEVESPAWWRLDFRQDPQKHVVLLRVTRDSASRFYRRLASRVSASRNMDAMVFIHGYNVTFEDAARRTAQVSYDLAKLSGVPPDFAPAPILYSWASVGNAAQYAVDENNVSLTVPRLKSFLEDLAARSGATTIHLIAHSMGNRALLHALDRMASAARTSPLPRFRQLVLAAPDIDAREFRQLAAAFLRTADRVTLYASSNDQALRLSQGIHGYARAGDTGDHIILMNGVDTIDASAVRTDFLGHSYYGDSATVLDDILQLLRDGSSPELRKGLAATRASVPRLWILAP